MSQFSTRHLVLDPISVSDSVIPTFVTIRQINFATVRHLVLKPTINVVSIRHLVLKPVLNFVTIRHLVLNPILDPSVPSVVPISVHVILFTLLSLIID